MPTIGKERYHASQLKPPIQFDNFTSCGYQNNNFRHPRMRKG